VNLKFLAVSVISLFSIGCTAISVKPVSSEEKVSHICIKENPKVIVSGFSEALEDNFESNLVTTQFFSGKKPDGCQYVLEYTALQSWDFVTYLSYAELKLYKDNSRVGYAEYRLRGKGGLSLLKWRGPKSKLKPVIEELLSEQKNGA